MTKFVYVLVTDGSDYFYEEMLLSGKSLLLHNPNARIYVVCDDDTYRLIADKCPSVICKENLVSVNVPKEYNKTQKSRFLKTNLRFYIDGDFLYIDNDTIVCEKLDVLTLNVHNVGAVYDCHTSHYDIDYKFLTQKEMDITKDISSFNSGVLYVKDNACSRLLYKEWHRLWVEMNKRGVNRDQPALRLAQAQTGVKLEKIDDVWNCMLLAPNGMSVAYWPSAKIYHYFHALFYRRIEFYLKDVKRLGDVPSYMESFLVNPYGRYEETIKDMNIHRIAFLLSPLYQFYIDFPKMYWRLVRFSFFFRKCVVWYSKFAFWK